jgi:hypothetical protein
MLGDDVPRTVDLPVGSAAGSATDATRMPCNNRIESRCAVSIITLSVCPRGADYMNRGRSLSDVKAG